MAFLKVMTGSKKGQRYEIDRDEVIIGRAPENVVCIDDPSVSSHHCSITRDGRRFTIKDLNSTNGTKLNNVGVKEYRLSPKDVVTAGSVDIMFDGDDVEPLTPPKATASTPQVTVRLAPSSGNLTPVGLDSAFVAKKDSRVAWVIAMVVVGVLALGAMAFFVYRLLTSGSLPAN